jgi:hypothetical protein
MICYRRNPQKEFTVRVTLFDVVIVKIGRAVVVNCYLQWFQTYGARVNFGLVYLLFAEALATNADPQGLGVTRFLFLTSKSLICDGKENSYLYSRE